MTSMVAAFKSRGHTPRLAPGTPFLTLTTHSASHGPEFSKPRTPAHFVGFSRIQAPMGNKHA